MVIGSQDVTAVASWNTVRTLGEGAYGEVKLLVDNRNAETAIAMKVVDLIKHSDPVVKKAVHKEALLMKMLRGHDNVIHFITMNVDENLHQFQLLLEYADGGELFDRIEPDVGMSTEKGQFYFRQLINGIEYIHSRGIAHRDIKPENILLTKNDVLKITDFGMATLFRLENKERFLETRCGTLPYVAPEVLQAPYRAQPADLWSCGVVLVTLLAGELPWDSPSIECDQYDYWCENSINMAVRPWQKIGNIALSLLRNILVPSANARADIEKIKRHPWFTRDFSRDRMHMSRTRSGVSNSNGLNLDSSKENDMNETKTVAGTDRPRKRPRRLDDLMQQEQDLGSASQPISSGEGCTPPKRAKPTRANQQAAVNSFSQPDNIEALLINFSQLPDRHSQSTEENWRKWMVQRMTRFCLCSVSLSEAIETVGSICHRLGFITKLGPCQQKMTVQQKRNKIETTFIVSVYEMTEDKVLVDLRRSRGDGLQFKRAFLAIRHQLEAAIAPDSADWLQTLGLLSTSQRALTTLSIH